MKPEKVVFLDNELQKEFEELSSEDPIKRGLIRAITELQENAFCGRNVKKSLIPLVLIKKYGINNLWIYNLPNAWRMIYTLSPSNEIEVIAVVLDWMDHKDYERLFGF